MSESRCQAAQTERTPTFTKIRLGDALSFVVDNRGKTPPLDSNGDFELLEINSIVGPNKRPNYGLISKRVSREVYKNWFRKGHPKVGDVLFSTVGSIAEVAYVAEERGCIAQNLVALRPRDEKLDGEFLYYVLSSPTVRQQIVSLDISSVQPSIKLPHLLDSEIEVPSISVQKAIANFLGTLDDKIDLNRRINQTLEQMAQALFKSWFVDFDPIKAKIAAIQGGRDPLRAAMSAISGKTDDVLDQLPPEQYQQLAATAALFPDEMVDSELGEIPKGWKVRPMPESIEVNPTRQLKKGAVAPHLDMANVPTNSSRAHTVVLREFASGSKFINGDTLLARITPCLENGKTAFVDFLSNDQIGWGSTEFIVLRPKGHLPVELAYFLCRHPDFRAFAIAQMAGTSGRQRVPNDCFANYLLTVPSQEVTVAFGVVAKCLMNQIRSQDEASKSLSTLRDTLLPKLLSGELDVSKLDQYIR